MTDDFDDGPFPIWTLTTPIVIPKDDLAPRKPRVRKPAPTKEEQIAAAGERITQPPDGLSDYDFLLWMLNDDGFVEGDYYESGGSCRSCGGSPSEYEYRPWGPGHHPRCPWHRVFALRSKA